MRDYIVNSIFKLMCRIFNVRDASGNPYMFTSHQLRHTGITDRIYSGQSILEIRDVTGHKNNEMIITSYIHESPEMIIEKQRSAMNTTSSYIPLEPVLFRGRILNMDETQERRLLQNPRAHKIGKIGICSDMTKCKCDVYECLDCPHFIPAADELKYFEDEVRIWEEKVEIFKNNLYMRENAEYNLQLHRKVVEKIQAISRNKEVMCSV